MTAILPVQHLSSNQHSIHPSNLSRKSVPFLATTVCLATTLLWIFWTLSLSHNFGSIANKLLVNGQSLLGNSWVWIDASPADWFLINFIAWNSPHKGHWQWQISWYWSRLLGEFHWKPRDSSLLKGILQRMPVPLGTATQASYSP